ncbi:tRNA-uridine aminocarboxypropyltransferase [Comamonas sp. 4034]|uniref:tRNA-uridine aminocarboxypropyltransferase n=1 Tax=Comamonas sp. 4034 TaxID=3156455 RepID=UPI003D21754C
MSSAPAPHPAVFPHAVSRLRTERQSRSTRPFLARGGPKGERCEGCRLRPSHCICALRPTQSTHAGVCLLMHDAEPLKPSNTGWLIADVVAETHAFGWSRTEENPALTALLSDPQWQPYVVFPEEFVQPASRVVRTVPKPSDAMNFDGLAHTGRAPVANFGKRPLFILLDATWPEARKMFRKSPRLDGFPVLSLHPDQISRYQLRRSKRDDHFCTAEVAALCLDLAGDLRAAQTLEAYLDVYTHHYLQAKHQLPPDWSSQAHSQLAALRIVSGSSSGDTERYQNNS